MKYRKVGGTVRRNVTLDKGIAESLGVMSDFTGYSQSELLTMALNQPIMKRFYAFAHPEYRNPVTELLEVYQADIAHMNPHLGESIIRAVKNWFETSAAMVGERSLSGKTASLNCYIYGHITEPSKQASTYMNQVYEEAKECRFITPGMGADELKAKVIKLMDVMLAEPMNKHLMGESYMYRCLLVIFMDCFERPKMKETIKLFMDLADGNVLPYFSTAPELPPEAILEG